MQRVGGDHLHASQHIGGVFFRACDTGFHLAASHADFVDQLAMLSYEWVTRQAPKYVDSPALNIVRLWSIAKQRPHVRVGQSATGVILVKRPL
ncbi:hypothetical protein D3C86_1738440 [compost metagenome]